MASASGTYVRTSRNGPNLLGNRKFSFVIKYWSSSSSVWNSDGQEINVKITANGSSQTINLGTLYGSNLGSYTSEDNAWSYTYTYTASVVVNGFSICSITKDKNNDGNFYAATGNINVVQAKITAPAINSTTTTSCTLSANVSNPYSEEIKYQNAQGNFLVTTLNASSSQRTVNFTVSNMPTNSAYTDRIYGHILPNGSASSPFVWGSGTYKIATSFTSMSMPTIKAKRNENDPTIIDVTWTAGGTTNKPKGSAYRTPSALAVLDGNAIYASSTPNLETAGSIQIKGVSLTNSYKVYCQYDIYGLDKQYNQKTNIVEVGAYTFNPYIKVSGTYKKCNSGYIKVNGSYKKISKAYIKINGAYKEIK